MKNCYNQLHELKIAQIRLETLEAKKIVLLTKITACTGNLKEVTVQTGFSNDKMDLYLIEKEELEEEIKTLKEEIRILKKGLEEMKTIIKQADSFEAKIFDLYFFENLKPKQIAKKLYCHTSTVYRKIEKINKKSGKLQKNAKDIVI